MIGISTIVNKPEEKPDLIYLVLYIHKHIYVVYTYLCILSLAHEYQSSGGSRHTDLGYYRLNGFTDTIHDTYWFCFFMFDHQTEALVRFANRLL